MDPTTTKIQYSPYYILHNIVYRYFTYHCTYYFFVYYYTADILYYLNLLRIYTTTYYNIVDVQYDLLLRIFLIFLAI